MKLWSGATATTIRQGSNQMSLFWGKALCDGIFFDKHVRPGEEGQWAGRGVLRGMTGQKPSCASRRVALWVGYEGHRIQG